MCRRRCRWYGSRAYRATWLSSGAKAAYEADGPVTNTARGVGLKQMFGYGLNALLDWQAVVLLTTRRGTK